MPISYTIAQPTTSVTAAADPQDLGAEDIAIPITVSPAGDYVTVTDGAATRQSILREFGANPNSFTHRPNWGIGAPELLFKGATSSTRDLLVSRAKTRLRINPRVSRTLEVSGRLSESGISMTIRVDSVKGTINILGQVFK